MVAVLWVLAVLIYLGIGVLFTGIYVLNYKPADRSVQIGLMGLFWPAFIVMDIVLTIAGGFGNVAKTFSRRIERANAKLGPGQPPKIAKAS